MRLDDYNVWRDKMCADSWGADQYEWSQTVEFPAFPDHMAHELIWVILNSGMKSAIARTIRDRIYTAWRDGKPTSTAFGHKGKVAAIDRIWANRISLHQEAQQLTGDDLVQWCERLPWIGPITKFHAAKNLGADVAKPDRWLDRVSIQSGESVSELCSRLARESGDRIATVDLVIWWACAHGGYRPSEPTHPEPEAQ